MTLSILLHGIFLGILATSPTVREALMPPPEKKEKPEITLRGRRLAEAASSIMEANRKKARQRLEDLKYVEQELRKMEKEQAERLGQNPPEPSVRDADSIQELDFADLYEESLSTESDLTEAYRDLRARELAAIRKIPLSEARQQTDIARPDRPGLDARILRAEALDPGTLEEQKDEAEKGLRELEAMVLLGGQLLDLARGMESLDEQGRGIQWISGLSDRDSRQRELASGAGAQVRDLTESEMGLGGGGAPPEPGSGSPIASDAKPVHPVVQPQIEVFAGRKIRDGGVRTPWMMVDSWYILGPFPNPGRQNLNRKFPPETVVDLDATYQGKAGQTIRWQYTQSGEAMVQPRDYESWAIYYAYTEVELDRERDLWIAIGSDDKSHVWVNDELVWVSADHHKSWNPGEGYRKVRFQKGLNRILYRVENGQLTMGFSLLIHVGKG